MEETIKLPSLQLLVSAVALGGLGTRVYGYYHYDRQDGRHYICTREKLHRIEIDKNTVKFDI